MKKLIAYILAAFAALALLSGCMEETVPEEVEQRYIAFLEATKTDWKIAVENYIHYEDEINKSITMQATWLNTDYEIKEWKKLTNHLWVVECNIIRQADEIGTDYYHFVGMIDGQYYVMLNPYHVPQELKEGLDLDSYYPEGDFIVVEGVMEG